MRSQQNMDLIKKEYKINIGLFLLVLAIISSFFLPGLATY
jgi:hypothetical protein